MSTPQTRSAVGPASAFKGDATRGVNRFDKWLRDISSGVVTLDKLAVVAGAVPVIGNAMAVVDTVFSIKEIVEKPKADMVDWINLAINIIGIIPGGNTARTAANVTVRPMLKYAKPILNQSGAVLSEAAISAIINHISAGHKGDIEKFLETYKSGLSKLLQTIGSHAQNTLNKTATAFETIASGKIFDTAQLHRRASQAFNNGTVFTPEGRNLYLLSASYKGEAVVKDKINAAVASMVPDKIKSKLKIIAQSLRANGLRVNNYIVGTAASLFKLFELILAAVRKRKAKRLSTSVPGKNKHHKDNKRMESADKQEHGKNKSAPSKNCCGTLGSSRKSIDFATGQETFTHTDFTLPGIMPISWSRTYCSGLITYEKGELGARWITPYTSRIGIRKNELLYHTTDGRAVSFPLLEVGRAWHHPIEDFTLARIDKDLLTLNVGKDLLEIYERDGNSFRLSAIKDRNGNALGFHYSGSRLIAVNDSNGHTIGISYNEQGKISRIELLGENPRLLAAYEYSAEGDLVHATDEAGDVREYTYRQHLVTRYSDRTGRGVNLEWSGRRHRAKCIREYNDDGSEELKLEWSKDIRETTVTDAYGHSTIYYYDYEGYTYRIIYPDSTEEWFYRDDRKNIFCHIHPDGSEDQYEYDERDNILEHIRADGSVVSFEYDADNNLTAVTDPEGHRWLRQYDVKGNMILEIDPEENETRYRYNDAGLPIEITDALGGIKTLTWTKDGQISSHTDCSGYTSRWQYDDRGRLQTQTDAEGNSTHYSYDSRGNPEAVIQADGTRESYLHDAEGRLLEHTDPLKQSTRYTYDKGGRLFIRTDALGQQVQYRYDLNSHLVGLLNQNGDLYGLRYNSVGALTEEKGFDGKITRYHYTQGSGVLERIDEAGTITKLDYDPAGRIESRSILVTDENGETHETDKENYAYDSSGRLAGTQNAHSRHQYFYDKLGNLIREYRHDSLDGTARSHVWHHRYDALGNRTETIRPDGQRIGYLHYGSGHLHGITLNRNEIAAFERDKLHRETERTFGKHIRQETQYDPMGRILQQIHNRSRREYGYDAAGQLTHIQSRGGQTQYRYDPIGRLIAAVTPDFSETFAFDPADNRLDLSGNKQDHTGQTNSQEKPSLNKVWGNLLKEYAGVHYDYDQRGNLIRKTRNGETTDYHWNGYNQLIKIKNRNGSTEYRYDPLGRRTAKIRNGETTVYHWQEDTLAIESTNGQNTHYLFEPGTFEPLAQFQTTSPIGIEREDKPAEPYSYDPETDPLLKIPPEPQEQSEVQPDLVYYQLDHLGTPIAAHNAKGEAVWTAEYEAWGRIRNETVSDDLKANIPFRFQGQYYDEESGQHYNRFRYYDPEIGRFVSQDPIGLMGGINVYIYASNPIEWVDPFGLASKSSFAVRHGPSAPQKINGKFPINSCFAGKTMTMKDVNQNILKKYPGLSSKYQHGVPFNMMGFPDFSRYAIRTVNLPGGFISDSKDFSQANRIAFGNSNNYKDKGNMIIDGKKYIWHHTEKNGKIQLIPYDLHDAIKHTGGAAICGTRKR
ncbi:MULTISPECIES: RHS repeat-associated core domain-containing protein [Neisseria]|uniref:DUF6531 domain-containing protein n=1 Tax=Neisseria macacae ATCC 33926 TaxID=997348 RepID=A0AA36UH16_9NEIS|nr:MULTISPECIES: RHS repeat-associated core domain-containing protein [Neisseria]EGQ75106.1 YD repeat-containing protein [Neisseria macacae ATCC 33926]UNV85298.1 DUF6531 domain-containing protein [Neisseria macacae ATCC 33926]